MRKVGNKLLEERESFMKKSPTVSEANIVFIMLHAKVASPDQLSLGY